MAFSCHKCGKELLLAGATQVGRRDTCPSCSADLHACLNCRHHDRSSYNECRESQAERVLDKDQTNFCDYFEFRQNGQKSRSSPDNAARKKLDELFK